MLCSGSCHAKFGTVHGYGHDGTMTQAAHDSSRVMRNLPHVMLNAVHITLYHAIPCVPLVPLHAYCTHEPGAGIANKALLSKVDRCIHIYINIYIEREIYIHT